MSNARPTSREPGLTLAEMREQFRPVNSGQVEPGYKASCLLRCHGAYNFAEVDYELVINAFDEIAGKVPLVQAGLDEFTNVETLLFVLLKMHAENGGA